jgi:hypothetical protein
MGELKNAHKVSAEKFEVNRTLARHRCSQDNNIKNDVKENEMAVSGVDSCGSGLLLATRSYDHGNVPSVSIKDQVFLNTLRNHQVLKEKSAAWS